MHRAETWNTKTHQVQALKACTPNTCADVHCKLKHVLYTLNTRGDAQRKLKRVIAPECVVFIYVSDWR